MGQRHLPCMKNYAPLRRTGKRNSVTMDAIRKFSNVYLLRNSNQMLAAQKNGRLLLPLLLGLHQNQKFQCLPKGDKALHKAHLSLTLLGTEEMPHGDAHPPPVHGINFKQDARLK